MQKGFSIIPLEIYLKSGRVKAQVALCRGKKLYDKRADLAKKQQKRELERDFKGANLRI